MAHDRASKRQRELLLFVDGFIKGNGYGPSYREIMRALGYKSVSTVAIHVDGLIARGYLRKTDNSARSLEVVTLQTEHVPVEPVSRSDGDHKTWLIENITRRIDRYRVSPTPDLLEDISTCVTMLRVGGWDEEHDEMRKVIEELATAEHQS